MSDSTDRTDAITIVTANVQSQIAPALAPEEIEAEVDLAQIARTWQAGTAYAIGDRVVPAIRNGHCYVCIQPGTSQAGARSYSEWPAHYGRRLVDGSSDPILIWEEEGEDLFNRGVFGQERNVYNIGQASRQCWLLKARKTSQLPDNGDVSLSQVYEHCMDQAKRFYPFRRQAQVVRA